MRSSNGLCRVSVHAGDAVVDLALPDGVPVGVLIASIADMVDGVVDGAEAKRYQLSLPGGSSLETSSTLAHHGIRDGSVLVLGRSHPPPPVLRYDDVAEAVSAALDPAGRSQPPWPAWRVAAGTAGFLTGIGVLALIRNAGAVTGALPTAGVAAAASVAALAGAALARRAYRDPTAWLALCLVGAEFAAAAGYLAVPGIPGTPNALLAGMAAAVAAVSAMPMSGCPSTTLTVVAGAAMSIAIAALTEMTTAAPLHTIGSVFALLSLAALGTAPRVSILLAGLSPQLPPAGEPDPAAVAIRAIRADNWLTGLLAVFASSAGAGALITVLSGAPRPQCVAFGAITGALLLLRARAFDGHRAAVVALSGIAVVAAAFAAATIAAPGHGPWTAAVTAVLAGLAMYVGFVAPALPASPILRVGMDLIEWLALAAMAPLTCWICGVYGAVRGWGLS
ncbi:MAG: type VII secretion integral membrane protein EccD [Mycobacterium sp.]|nr:type VII secretion integral membrane protein EccD [Mycobacterium sp.]